MSGLKKIIPYQSLLLLLIIAAVFIDGSLAFSPFLFYFYFPAVVGAAAFGFAFKHGLDGSYWLISGLALLPLLLLYGKGAGLYILLYLLLSLAAELAGGLVRKRYRTLRVYAR